MTEGIYVHLHHAGQLPEVIIPYAQAENLDPATYSYNSSMAQSRFVATHPLGWYNYEDDHGNIVYADFNETYNPYKHSLEGDYFPTTNAPITKPIQYDFKAYHKDDHLYRSFARDWYEKFGIRTPTDKFEGDDPGQPMGFSRLYYNRELKDFRNIFVYSYDLRFTVLDDIKYGKMAPNIISHYMSHLYSGSKKRNGVSDDDDIYF